MARIRIDGNLIFGDEILKTGPAGEASYLIFGHGGDDVIVTGSGSDILYGGLGNDFLNGGSNDDILRGEWGEDELRGGNGDDKLYGGDDEDDLSGGAHKDTLEGGRGNDVLKGDSGNDKLSGGDGNDRLEGGTGNDTLNGGNGDDELNGGDGTDVFRDFGGRDQINGGAGIDTLDYSSLGSDYRVTVNLASGASQQFRIITSFDGGQNGVAQGLDSVTSVENVKGTSGDDTIAGNDADNRLEGNNGNDNLKGRDGNDALLGGAGTDTVTGGRGQDTMTGGSGDDKFVFDTALIANTWDTITDFRAVDDTIALDNDVFTALASGPLAAGAFKVISTAQPSGLDASDRVIYSTATGLVCYDPDGSGAQTGITVAQLDPATAGTLTHNNFLIIA